MEHGYPSVERDTMGLFDSLFEKKYCTVCGKELGAIFGKTKIADGHICKDCSGQLSPYFHGHGAATTADIKAQIAGREQNKEAVAAFHVTKTLGNDTKVYVDEDNGKVIITRTSPSGWASSNPDVLDFSQITGCDYRVKETKTEIKRKLADGKEESFDPKRYDTDYDVYVTVYVSHPYVEQIEFKLNPSRIDKRTSPEFQRVEELAQQIRETLTGIHAEQVASTTPREAVTCPHCAATTTPDGQGRCEYCGSVIA